MADLLDLLFILPVFMGCLLFCFCRWKFRKWDEKEKRKLDNLEKINSNIKQLMYICILDIIRVL